MESFIDFPKEIRKFPVRKFDNEPVSTGRINMEQGLRGKRDNIKRVKLADFRKQLQCSPDNPDLNGRNGGMSMLKLVPPTKKIVELMCVWAETKCAPWYMCHKLLDSYLNGSYPHHWGVRGHFLMFQQFHLLRVIKGNLSILLFSNIRALKIIVFALLFIFIDRGTLL
jgi:hypothetical protein